MTKADLSEIVYEKAGLSKRECSALVDALFETMKETLANGEGLKISGFGSFAVRAKAPRVGRNPQTGESITLPGRKVVTFRASTVLKGDLDG